jgi:hypothetical protein
MTTTLTITPEQAELLQSALAEQQIAARLAQAVFATIIRGHGLLGATLTDLQGTALTVSADDGAV